MKILALDISSHTGWSIVEDGNLLSFGQKDIPCHDKSWPLGIIQWSKDVAQEILKIIEQNPVDKILIERANSSKFRNSQNFIDWFHYELINLLVDEGYFSMVSYIDTSHWRRICNLKLNKDQKKQNKLAKQASKDGKILKINGKRKGKISKKHLAVNFANDKFNLNLKLKQNDIAESICIAMSYFIENGHI